MDTVDTLERLNDTANIYATAVLWWLLLIPRREIVARAGRPVIGVAAVGLRSGIQFGSGYDKPSSPTKVPPPIITKVKVGSVVCTADEIFL